VTCLSDISHENISNSVGMIEFKLIAALWKAV
jgi:hypothetical protein